MNRTKRTTTVSGLRLSEEELKAIVQAKSNPPGSEKRIHRRVDVPDSFPLLMQLQQGTDSDTVSSVVAKDLSSQGVGFFHASYVYPGTRAKFIMRDRGSEPVALEGTIRRCRHIAGRVHELGAVFEAPVELERFVEVPPDEPAPAPTPLTEAEIKVIQERVGALAVELKKMADEHAALDQINAKITELLAAMQPPARPAPVPGAEGEKKPEPPAEAKADAAGEPVPSAH